MLIDFCPFHSKSKGMNGFYPMFTQDIPRPHFPKKAPCLPQVVPQQRGPRHRQYLLAAAASLRENGENDMGQTSQKSYENDECQ